MLESNINLNEISKYCSYKCFDAHEYCSNCPANCPAIRKSIMIISEGKYKLTNSIKEVNIISESPTTIYLPKSGNNITIRSFLGTHLVKSNYGIIHNGIKYRNVRIRSNKRYEFIFYKRRWFFVV